MLFFCYLFLLSLSEFCRMDLISHWLCGPFALSPAALGLPRPVFEYRRHCLLSQCLPFRSARPVFPLCGRTPDPKDFSENRPCCPFGNLRLPLACFSHRYHFQRPIPNPDFLLKKHPVRGAFCLLKFQIVFFDPTDLAQQKAECKAEKCRQNETDEK